jgi:hypothetical protein
MFRRVQTSFKSVALALTLFFLVGCLEQEARVVVHAPIDVVWEYTADSSKAADWSIYFDHITPLAGIADGQVGAVRRCYRYPDETGMTWDEKVVSTQAPHTRQIRTYGIKNSAIGNMDSIEFDVFHSLKSLGPNETELTFSSRLAKNDLSYFKSFLLYLASFKSARIVQKNVENIKMLIEANGAVPSDLHPYMKSEYEF